ncbi:uncharacterized protein LOC123553134 [Mercenaria mercenaria]|uniref:uncharacterized protein LOC123553134 n=1 Tax=Mercenaria mercenaria TaxID=6596 RepID=UPI001E1D52A1|nr:uncharacterized protein LOC123553134 [Mercenaria mercenaria]
MKHIHVLRYIVVILVIYLSLLLWMYHYFFKTAFRTDNNSVGMMEVFQRESGSNSAVLIKKFGTLPDWNSRCLLSNATDISLLAFRQTITQKEFLILRDILVTFKHACETNNLTYLLYGGSLLGAYRHAGLIPWDDDVDIWMDFQQAPMAERVLRNILGYSLQKEKGDTNLWKLSSDSSKPNKTKTGRREVFPYIHILFFVGNSTHVRHLEGAVNNRTVFPRNDIFPPKKMLFEDEEYFIPNNAHAVIKRKYGQTNVCTARDLETLQYVKAVSCDELYPYYPFITRTHVHNIQRETLTFGGKIIWQQVSKRFGNRKKIT